MKKITFEVEDGLFFSAKEKLLKNRVTMSDFLRGCLETIPVMDYVKDPIVPKRKGPIESAGVEIEERGRSVKKKKVLPGCLGAIAHETGMCGC